MKIDPVCGMNVDEASALHAEHAGQTCCCCNAGCRDKYMSQFAPG